MSERSTLGLAVGVIALVLAVLTRAAAPITAPATEPASDAQTEKSKYPPLHLAWYDLNDQSKFRVLGLFWFAGNQPKFWRMPADRVADLPHGVQRRCKEPAGARILLVSDSANLALKITPSNKANQKGFDVYLDGRFYRSVAAEEADVEKTLVLFRDLERKTREILIYLPDHQEVRIGGVGADPDATFSPPQHAFANPLPVVFYGSSVCQGTGAAKPGMSYEAIISRALNVDFINLGFGGAGKAERGVVELVNSIPACCYVFDLGKSYGMQDAEPYRAMLQTIRRTHPDVPIVCMTPITSALEVQSESYAQRSKHDREVMTSATEDLIRAGDNKLYLLRGEDLLGFADHDGLSRDGVHPSDHGYSLIAQRLLPTLEKAIGISAAARAAEAAK